MSCCVFCPCRKRSSKCTELRCERRADLTKHFTHRLLTLTDSLFNDIDCAISGRVLPRSAVDNPLADRIVVNSNNHGNVRRLQWFADRADPQPRESQEGDS
jgi:hypothetical protein